MTSQDERETRTDVIRARHVLLMAIREFFYERGYVEVETPYLMRTAPADPYIEPLEAFVDGAGGEAERRPPGARAPGNAGRLKVLITQNIDSV